MKFLQRSKALLTIAALVIMAATACQKSDTTVTLPSPKITDAGIKDGKATIAVGDQLLLKPVLQNKTGVTYLWIVNSQAAGTDSVLTFTPTQKGNYRITFKTFNNSGEAVYDYQITVNGKYENGVFIVNEGQYGQKGSVNYYRYGEDTIRPNVFQLENTGKELGITTQYGSVFNNKLYLVSKQGAFVVTDAATLKETGRIAQLPEEGRAFCGIDNNKGLISTANGLYNIDLQTLTVGQRVAGINGEIGALLKANNYIFVLSQTDGLIVLNQGDLSIAKNLGKMSVGIAPGTNGNIWAAYDNLLYRINTQTLDVTSITLPFSVAETWGFWNAGNITASTKDNVVYIAKTESYGSLGNQVYRYVVGDNNSLQTPFITLPADRQFYGAGIRYDARNNDLSITALKGFGTDATNNGLLIYDATTGGLKKHISYSGYYFPAIPVFN